MFLSKSQTQPSIIEQTPLQNNDDWNSIIFTKTAWLLLAVAINTFEQFIPRLPFLPWLKPGLANCITILWIVKFGWKDAFVYALLRVWISGFYFGFSLLTFGLGLSGGILSTLIMGLLWETLGKKQVLSTIGIGIIGALFHNLGQLGAVYVLVAQNVKLFYQLPIMVIASIIFGGTVGAIAPYIWTSIHSIETPANIITKTDRFAFHRKPIQLVFSLSLLAFCISLLFIQSWHILLIVSSYSLFTQYYALPQSILWGAFLLLGVFFALLAIREFESERVIQPVVL